MFYHHCGLFDNFSLIEFSLGNGVGIVPTPEKINLSKVSKMIMVDDI